MTFSIIGHDSETGRFGIAIATSSLAVGNRCPWARSGIGAVTTQARTDIRLGPKGLDLLATGLSAQETVDRLVAESEYPQRRQLGVIDRNGNTAFYSGPDIQTVHAGCVGRHCVSTGNGLDNPEVPQAIVASFEKNTAVPFVDRLLDALDTGLAAGGEWGPVHSAALLVVDKHDWPLVDLRVDYEDNPERKLRSLWKMNEPKLAHFIRQVLEPNDIPREEF